MINKGKYESLLLKTEMQNSIWNFMLKRKGNTEKGKLLFSIESNLDPCHKMPEWDGPLSFYQSSSHFGKINCLNTKNQRKKLSADKFPKKNCLHNIGKVGKSLFCNLLDAIIWGVW